MVEEYSQVWEPGWARLVVDTIESRGVGATRESVGMESTKNESRGIQNENGNVEESAQSVSVLESACNLIISNQGSENVQELLELGVPNGVVSALYRSKCTHSEHSAVAKSIRALCLSTPSSNQSSSIEPIELLINAGTLEALLFRFSCLFDELDNHLNRFHDQQRIPNECKVSDNEFSTKDVVDALTSWIEIGKALCCMVLSTHSEACARLLDAKELLGIVLLSRSVYCSWLEIIPVDLSSEKSYRLKHRELFDISYTCCVSLVRVSLFASPARSVEIVEHASVRDAFHFILQQQVQTRSMSILRIGIIDAVGCLAARHKARALIKSMRYETMLKEASSTASKNGDFEVAARAGLVAGKLSGHSMDSFGFLVPIAIDQQHTDLETNTSGQNLAASSTSQMDIRLMHFAVQRLIIRKPVNSISFDAVTQHVPHHRRRRTVDVAVTLGRGLHADLNPSQSYHNKATRAVENNAHICSERAPYHGAHDHVSPFPTTSVGHHELREEIPEGALSPCFGIGMASNASQRATSRETLTYETGSHSSGPPPLNVVPGSFAEFVAATEQAVAADMFQYGEPTSPESMRLTDANGDRNAGHLAILHTSDISNAASLGSLHLHHNQRTDGTHLNENHSASQNEEFWSKMLDISEKNSEHAVSSKPPSSIAAYVWECVGVGGKRPLETRTRRGKLIKTKQMRENAIPRSLRSPLWERLLLVEEALAAVTYGKYSVLKSSVLEESVHSSIEADVTRTMPLHCLFWYGGARLGVDSLRNILTAYAAHFPEIGYCQGMSSLAAIILIHSRSEERAYDMFCRLMERVGFYDMFLPGFPKLWSCLSELEVLTRRFFPRLMTHFEEIDLPISLFADKWFLTALTYNFPHRLLFRLWDLMLIENSTKVILRSALAVFKLSEQSLLKMDFEQAIMYLQSEFADPTSGILQDENQFIHTAYSFRFTRRSIAASSTTAPSKRSTKST